MIRWAPVEAPIDQGHILNLLSVLELVLWQGEQGEHIVDRSWVLYEFKGFPATVWTARVLQLTCSNTQL